ncbi:MAG: N-acetyltransferase family protein [Acidimicrobiales bacterium]
MTPATSSSEVTVRDAEAPDIRRLVELLAHGSLTEGREDGGDLAPYVAALAEITRSPGGVLVAVVDGEVVGVCQLIVFRHLQAHGGLCAEVESVHVHPARRGHGIGHVLMGAAIARAREAGCYRVQLTSNVVRTDAHRFYESLGFVPSHRGFKLALR